MSDSHTMPAHVFIPLLAIGSLVLTGAFVAMIQPRVPWLRWMGAGILASAAVSAVAFIFVVETS
ncbi:hypothetical protein SAMN05444004_11497 [Jannaschia faecimaris]|uniref:Uncharacterized protein n=1 Tax=Jannaschia faecimaris TaxID=1244108 RepID=A0A1H3T1C5_9RHOB|nr:hypothetical protein [Jannaschia faecimaris]SDZ43830.1 hypothetical protein SAMN05444004_11497 [Jannaschia faecimaris]